LLIAVLDYVLVEPIFLLASCCLVYKQASVEEAAHDAPPSGSSPPKQEEPGRQHWKAGSCASKSCAHSWLCPHPCLACPFCCLLCSLI